MNHDNCSIIVNTQTVLSQWCVYEHWATLKADEPPVCIMVGSSKLVDVYKLLEGRINSEWTRIFASGGHVMVRIVATADDRKKALQLAVAQSRKYDPLPVCNRNGFALYGGLRRIVSSTGEVFANQREAANALGVSSPTISRHLSGELQHVRGVVLHYAAPEASS